MHHHWLGYEDGGGLPMTPIVFDYDAIRDELTKLEHPLRVVEALPPAAPKPEPAYQYKSFSEWLALNPPPDPGLAKAGVYWR